MSCFKPKSSVEILGFLRSQPIKIVFLPDIAYMDDKLEAINVFPSPETDDVIAITCELLLLWTIKLRLVLMALSDSAIFDLGFLITGILKSYELLETVPKNGILVRRSISSKEDIVVLKKSFSKM